MHIHKLENPDESAPLLLPVMVVGVLAAISGVILFVLFFTAIFSLAD